MQRFLGPTYLVAPPPFCVYSLPSCSPLGGDPTSAVWIAKDLEAKEQGVGWQQEVARKHARAHALCSGGCPLGSGSCSSQPWWHGTLKGGVLH
eukprot:6045349-Amphidinium_carterae.1